MQEGMEDFTEDSWKIFIEDVSQPHIFE